MHDKEQLYAFTRRAYRFLREHPEKVEIAKIRERARDKDGKGFVPVAGKCTVDKEISLDYRKDLISTLVHELLHAFHPDWAETTVLREESALINQLSSRQVKNLIKAFAEVL